VQAPARQDKIDLAPMVGVSLEVMDRDARKMK